MVGFLKTLEDKGKNKLVKTASPEVSKETILIEGPLVSAPGLLPEPTSNGTDLPQLPDVMSSPIIKKEIVNVVRPLALDESQPWWLTEPRKQQPHLCGFLFQTREMVAGMLPQPYADADVNDAIKKSLDIVSQRMAAEIRLSQGDKDVAVEELKALFNGKGPLQPLYDDPAVTDIYVDSFDRIKCLRRGQALDTPFRFRSEEEYRWFWSRLLKSAERELSERNPIVECVLDDGFRSRVSALHESVRDGRGDSYVVRVPRLQQVTFYDLLKTKTLPAGLAAWLAEAVSAGALNILVVGATGAGKTAFATALLSAVGTDERVCTIEDVPEIFIPTAHLEKLVTRPHDGKPEHEITMEQLLRAVLRRAPHRIVVGEIRDKEAPLFLRALETGHAGSVATLHASNAEEGLWSLVDILSQYENAPSESLVRRISRSIHLVITMRKIQGKPTLVDVTEVMRPEGGKFSLCKLVAFDGGESGSKQWVICQRRSQWLDRMKELGVELSEGPALKGFESMERGAADQIGELLLGGSFPRDR